jgi:hypothetical protein
MSQILQSLGIPVGSGVPDPAKLLNQQAVDNQLQVVKNQVSSVINSIDLATKAGQLIGLSQPYIDKLNGLKDKGKSLLDQPNMTPDQLYTKMKGLDTEYKTVLAEQEKKADDLRAQKAKQAVDSVRARLREIEADSTTSKGLKDKYQLLLADAEAMYKTIEGALEAAKEVQQAAIKEGFQEGGTPTPGPTLKVADSLFQETPDSILDRLQRLNLEKEAEEEKTFDVRRATRRFFLYFKKTFWYVSLAFAAMFGGMILSNFYIDEPFWAIKIYYFLIGAALFPLTLLLGVIAPPYMHSLLIPLVENSAIAPVSTPPPMQGGAPIPLPLPAPIGFLESIYTYEKITPAAIDLRLSPTKSSRRISALITSVAMAGIMYWNDFFTYLSIGG